MSEENKLVEESKDNKPSSGDNKKRSKRCEEPFPPKLRWWQYFILVLNYIAVFLAALYLIEQFCSIHPLSFITERFDFLRAVCRPCVWGTYIAFSIVVAVIVIHYCVWNKIIVHKARLEDRSEVDAIIVEVDTVEPRLMEPEERPRDYARKKQELMEEKKRLKDIGERGWTEYQVLSLNQLLVDFLKEDELRGRALASLEDLQEYTGYSSDRHDPQHYEQWRERIDKAIKNIRSDEEDKLKRDEAAEMLRGELKTLLEHVADYEQYWVRGSVIVRGLMTCGVSAIPILLAMGLLPIIHPNGSEVLGILNWGFLGIAGAITAVLLNLHKSDLLYVGSTLGKKHLWRTVLGAALGLVAGVILYSMIAGGILSGSAFPEINSKTIQNSEGLDIGRSIFWGITSGFSFEWVFDHLRRTTEEGS